MQGNLPFRQAFSRVWHRPSPTPKAPEKALWLRHCESQMSSGTNGELSLVRVYASEQTAGSCPSAKSLQSVSSSQLRTMLVGGHSAGSLHSPLVVPAARSTVRQQTLPVVGQNTQLSPQRTTASPDAIDGDPASVSGAGVAGTACVSAHPTATHVCSRSQPK